jgi:hypothetical protein
LQAVDLRQARINRTSARRQISWKRNFPDCGSVKPLHLLIDHTGIKAVEEEEWIAQARLH